MAEDAPRSAKRANAEAKRRAAAGKELARRPGRPAVSDLRDALVGSDDEGATRKQLYAQLREHALGGGPQAGPAAALLDELAEERPGDERLAKIVAAVLADRVRMGRERLDAGAADEAIALLRVADGLARHDRALPRALNARQLLSQALSECARVQLDEGDVEPAARGILEAAELLPGDPHVARLVTRVVDVAAQTMHASARIDRIHALIARDPQLATARVELLMRRAAAQEQRSKSLSAVLIYHDAYLLWRQAALGDDAPVREPFLAAVRALATTELPPRKLLLAGAALRTATDAASNDSALRGECDALFERGIELAVAQEDYRTAAEIAQLAGDVASPAAARRMLARSSEFALRISDRDTAIALLRRLVRHASDAAVTDRLAELLEQRGRAAKGAGELDLAIQAYREARSLPGMQRRVEQDRRLRSALAGCLRRVSAERLGAGDHPRAAATIVDALEMEPADEQCRRLRSRIATAAVKAGDFDLAAGLLSDWMRRDPGDTEAIEQLAWVHARRGAMEVRAKRAPEAVASYRLALEIELARHADVGESRAGELAGAHVALAGALASAGDHEAAAVQLRAALALGRDHPTLARVALQCTLAGARDQHFGDALQVLQELHERHPDARIGLTITNLQLRAGDLEGALAGLRIVERDGGGSADDADIATARTRVARALRERALAVLPVDGVEAADPLVRRAVELAPDDELIQSLHALVQRLPREPIARQLANDREDAVTLVVVENRTDLNVLGCYLRVMGRHEAYAERLIHGFVRGVDALAIDEITGHVTIGQSEDVRIACRHRSPRRGGPSAGATSIVRARSRAAQGLDLLDFTAWELDDMLFKLGRKLDGFRGLMRSGRFARVVFILGENRLAACLHEAAARELGADNVHYLWCSAKVDRYDAHAWPLAELASRTRDTEIELRAPVGARARILSDGAPNESRGRSSGARRPRSRRLLTVLTSRGMHHVENTVHVLCALSPLFDVQFVLPPNEESERFHAYGALVTESPERYSFVSICDYVGAAGGGFGDAFFEQLDATVRLMGSDDRAAAMRMGDIAMWPLLEPLMVRLVGAELVNYHYFTTGFWEYLLAERPSALLVSPDRRTECRIACELGRRAGVPSVFPQTALIADSPVTRTELPGPADAFDHAAILASSPRMRPPAADYMTVIDEFAQAVMQRLFAIASERLPITGIPRFDGVQAGHDVIRAHDGGRSGVPGWRAGGGWCSSFSAGRPSSPSA